MKNVVIILIGLAVFLGGLSAAGTLTPSINRERAEQNLTVSDTVYDLPPEMAVAQAALGTFRGLAINVLWERAETLKNEGKFHEAIELGKLITKLQPRYPKVWEFVSWNLSYNISVATHTPEERWMWVKAGIDLLQQRGGGIDANPNELALYQQLGWIYFHKIGEFLDNMSWHYKRELADMWHSILGIPPRDPAAYEGWFRPIVEAPDNIQSLPEGAQRLARWLQEEGHPFDRHTLRRFTVPTVITDIPVDPAAAATQPSDLPQPTRVVPELAWPEWASQQDIDVTLAFLRRKAITSDELNMDPAIMLRFAGRFGTIDWRHPSAHNLYWSQLGLERLGADDGRQTDNEINTKRNVLNALQALAQSGQVVYQAAPDAGESYISYLPHWSFWLAYDDYFQQDVINDTRRSSEALEEAFGPGHRNQMDAAIAASYTFGDEAAADRLYRRMQDRYAGTDAAAEYEIPLSDFALQQLEQTLDQPQVVRGLIVGLITQSITSRVLHRNPQLAETQFNTARRLFDQFVAQNPNPMDPLRQEMGAFENLQISAIGSFIAGNAGPAGIQQVPIQSRVGVYRALAPDIQAVVYLEHGQSLQQEAARLGFPVEELFPPPPQEVFDRVQQQLMQGAQQPPVPQGTRQEVR